MNQLLDSFGRAHSYLRVSVTDRCNYRCVYCMPEDGMNWAPREDLLTYEEIGRIVHVVAMMGIRKVRITGGEPTVRSDILSLIAKVADTPGISDVAMTTNGHTLAKLAPDLAASGLNRLNISIDSLNRRRFALLTRGGSLDRVLAGITAARAMGLTPIKLNVVMLRGHNEDELVDFVEFCAEHAGDTQLRFIEYMPFEQRRYQTVPSAELRQRLSAIYTTVDGPERRQSDGPAKGIVIENYGLNVGFISPLSEHFCASCNRLRLMANGHLRTCLAHEDTPSLRDLIRRGSSDQQIGDAVQAMVLGKPLGHACEVDGGTLFEGTMTAIGG